MSQRQTRLVTLLCLLFAAAALLAAGGQARQQAFLTRGIPDELPGPITGAGVRLGINVDLNALPADDWAGQLARMRAAGITHVKQAFFFTPGFDWTQAERIVAAVTAADLTLVPLLDGDPAQGFAPPEDPALFASWTGAFAARFGEAVDAYIIWDEPNLASHWGGGPVNAAAYAALLAAAAETIRAADATALIVAAPLAPTVETGPANLSDVRYLQLLYEEGVAGAFDVAAGKPYGFDTGPDDRRVDPARLNFSRVILLRELMAAHGDADKALWAGNWGWNSLPADWQGAPSIWGEEAISAETQATWIVDGLARAHGEWPWMGVMFLENWVPSAAADDPLWGFSIADRPAETVLAAHLPLTEPATAAPGFHLAHDDDPSQRYQGAWRFSADFGADAPDTGDLTPEAAAANAATFRFWGTDVGLRVRRADYRARFFVTIDGQPANALPRDEDGRAMLVLTAADPAADYVALEPVARNLPPGEHVLRLEPYRGWNQWALNGFSVLYRPPGANRDGLIIALSLLAFFSGGLGVWFGRRATWSGWLGRASAVWVGLSQRAQLLLTGALAVVVSLSGWLTWGEQTAGLYRRLGDLPQLALTAAAASTFYVAPSFLVYVAALATLILLIYLRPAWGIALVAAALPWSVRPKPMLGYRFSPVEIFILAASVAILLRWWTGVVARRRGREPSVTVRLPPLHPLDLAVLALVVTATVSLVFTARLDVAVNEWRTVIVEPAIFYGLLRVVNLSRREWWTALDAFALGGLLIAAIGLGQFALGENLITAEGGLLRLRSIYGSPNNVALYLGRVWPLLAAMVMLGSGRRRLWYGIMLLPIGLAWLLTFSKGALFLGMPAAMLVLVVAWRRANDRPAWPWVLGLIGGGAALLLLATQIPALEARLDPRGETGFLRLSLWRASLNMALDHPWTGVGLDNFLYEYRGAYLFDTAWREPNLNHPHNIVLDFATRLGMAGLMSGIALFGSVAVALRRWCHTVSRTQLPALVGLWAILITILVHGLVDHSFFLVDLAGSAMLLGGLVLGRHEGDEPA